MAVLLCESNINFTAPSWKVADTNFYVNTEASSWFWNTTTQTISAAATTGAITVEGIAVKFSRINTNAGTVTVEIYNNTTASVVSGATQTINVSDLAFQSYNASLLASSGWIYFKFAAAVTLVAGNSYTLRARASVANTAYFVLNNTYYCTALITSTTAAPAANDHLIIAAPLTGTTPTAITCTMDNTTTTSFGGIEVGAYSRFILQNNVSTNYYLSIASGTSLSNSYFVCALNSVTEFGTTVNPVDSTSSMTLELKSASLGNNFLYVRHLASFTMAGMPITRIAKLNANASAGATSLTTDISTNWKSGDNIVFAQTNRSATPTNEKKALTANASGSSLSINALTSAKLGIAPIQCHIGNVTSNAKIIGTSTSATSYIVVGGVNGLLQGTTYFTADNVEFRYLGNEPSHSAAIVFGGTINTHTFTVTNCGFHDLGTTNQRAIYTITNQYYFNIQNNVFYGGQISLDGLSGTYAGVLRKFSGNLMIGGIGPNFYGQYGTSYFDEFKNNILSSTTSGYSITIYDITDGSKMSNNISYGNTGVGALMSLTRSNINTFTSYLNNGFGLQLSMVDSTIDSITAFGNTTQNIYLSGNFINSIISNATINSYAVNTTNYAFRIDGPAVLNAYFDNCSIGTTVVHTSNTVLLGGSAINVTFRNCSIGENSPVSSFNTVIAEPKVSFQRFNGIAASHRTYKACGTMINDSLIYDTPPSSQRLTPSTTAVYRLRSTTFQIAVASGSTATVSVKVRKSVVGDGTAYNGNQPRLILKSNPSAGSAYNSDIVCATATAAAGTWETLSYTTPVVTDNVGLEFYVDCSGNNGWVNVDTFVSNNNNSMKYYNNGEPINDISTGGGEKSFTFVG